MAMALLTAMTLAGLAWRIRSLVSPERSLSVKSFIKCTIVDHIDSLFEMGLACSCRIELPAPVIEAESHIGRLLDLSYQKASVGSMYRSRSYIYDVTLSWSDDIEKFVHRSVLAPFVKLLRSHIPSETAIHLCTRLSIHDIPYLRLSERVVSFSSHLIIRMDLNGKLVIDIKELDQKRELTSIIIVDILAHDPFKIGFHDFAYGVSCKPAVADHRILNAHVGELPAFSDLHIGSENGLVAVFITLYEMLSKVSHKRLSSPRSS